MSRRACLAVAAVVIAAAAWLLLRGPGEARRPQAGPAQGEAPSGGGPAATTWSSGRAARRTGEAARAEEPRGAEAALLTPPVDRAMTEAEGLLEVEVRARGAPVEAAEVRLYWRGARDPNTGQTDWRLAGVGRTGPQGKARLPSRPGAYLVSARSGELAPARRTVARPQGEALTKVVLELGAGVALEGRTVAKGSGEAVPLASVTLTPASVPMGPLRLAPRADAPPDERVLLTSDERGRFRAAGLAPGTWSVSAKAPGQARADARRVQVPGAAEVVLELAAAAFLEGRVVDPRGAGVAGADVLAAGGPELHATTTSASGAFSLEVEPGALQLSARKGSDAAALARPVIVGPGATERGLLLTLGKGGVIEGTVVSSNDGRPVEGAEVLVSPHDLDGDSGRVTTDARGAFAVEGLPPGSWDVVARKEGLAPDERRGVSLLDGQRFPLTLSLRTTGLIEGTVRDERGNGLEGARVSAGRPQAGFGGGGPGGLAAGAEAETRSGPGGLYRLIGVRAGRVTATAAREGVDLGVTQPVEVRDGEVAKADFVLPGDGEVSGHVTKKGGALPEQVVVRAFSQGGGGMGRFFMGGMNDAATRADPDGAYKLRLPAGTYRLVASAADAGPMGRTSSDRAVVVVEADRSVVKDLALPEDQPDRPGLVVTVLEPGGVPSTRADVRIAGPGGRGFALMLVTDESGRFTTPRPREDLPDQLTLRAQNGGRLGEAQVPPGQTEAVVQLRPGATLKGRLRGEPAPASFTLDAKVSNDSPFLLGGSSSLEFVGDQFVLNDAPGAPLSLSVKTGDGRTGKAEVQLQPGGAAEVEVLLTPASVVTGRLVDDAGAPVPEAFVSVDGSPLFGEGAPSSKDGAFRVEGLSPGEHTFRAFAGPQRRLEKMFAVAGGAKVDLGVLVLARPKADPGTVGLQLRGDSESVLIVWVLPDGPADRAGLKPGDALEAVDGAPVKGVDDARLRLKGAPGSAVQVTVRRNAAPVTVLVERAK